VVPASLEVITAKVVAVPAAALAAKLFVTVTTTAPAAISAPGATVSTPADVEHAAVPTATLASVTVHVVVPSAA